MKNLKLNNLSKIDLNQIKGGGSDCCSCTCTCRCVQQSDGVLDASATSQSNGRDTFSGGGGKPPVGPPPTN